MAIERTYDIRFRTTASGDGAEKTAAGFEKMNLAGREARHILSQVFGPEAANLMRAAGGPLVIAEGMVLIYKQIKEGMEAIHEQHLKLITDARAYAEEIHTASVKALDEHNSRMAEWARHQEHLLDNEDLLTKAMERNLALDNQRTAALKTQVDMSATLAEARVGFAEAAGAITKLQAEEMILNIKFRQKEIDDKIAEDEKSRQAGAATTRSLQAGRAAETAGIAIAAGETAREPIFTQLAKGQAAAARLGKENDTAQTAAAQALAGLKSGDYLGHAAMSDEHIREMYDLYKAGKYNPQTGQVGGFAVEGRTISAFETMRRSRDDRSRLGRPTRNQQAHRNSSRRSRRPDHRRQGPIRRQHQTCRRRKSQSRPDQCRAWHHATRPHRRNQTTNPWQFRVRFSRPFRRRRRPQTGNIAGWSPGNNLERDIAQAIAGIAVHATG